LTLLLLGTVFAVPTSREVLLRKLVAAANERPTHPVRYEPAYVRLSYPGGDVPSDTGVCTDEVIRVYRAVGIDLQKDVHEDVVANPGAYIASMRPGQRKADANIDHRRVPMLRVFFRRNAESLPTTQNPDDYVPGDIVTWDLGRGLTHIGLVVDQKSLLRRRYKILHNIGAGPKIDDSLFDWKITGHFRYYGVGH